MTQPTPSLGRIVLVGAEPMLNNGSDVAPAVITRVWNDTCVNVRVLLDGHTQPEWRTSVYLFADKDTADAHPAVPVMKAYWPPRA